MARRIPKPRVKDGIHIVNLSSYTAPEVVESRKKIW